MQDSYLNTFKKSKATSMLLVAFFIVSFIEIVAEYAQNKFLIWLSKPLILPLLMLYYLKCSKRTNHFYLMALVSGWVANLLFIQSDFAYIFYGVLFFLVYRILIIYIIANKVKMPNSIPLLLGSMPFVFLYAIVTLYTYSTLGSSVYLFLIQGVFTIFLGGFSLGNYIMISNNPNRMLLVSTMFMTLNQFIFLLKFYYNEVNVLQAIAMILFVFGQFLLTKYMFHIEKSKQKYEVIHNLTESV